MSQRCKIKEVPLLRLRPAFVEFTPTKGVLRVLKPGESRTRAEGLIFWCPRCSHDKNRAHYCIFLFNLPQVHPESKPHGRFEPTVWTFEEHSEISVPADFSELGLRECHAEGERHPWLKPSDLPCKWEGTVDNGVVRWRER